MFAHPPETPEDEHFWVNSRYLAEVEDAAGKSGRFELPGLRRTGLLYRYRKLREQDFFKNIWSLKPKSKLAFTRQMARWLRAESGPLKFPVSVKLTQTVRFVAPLNAATPALPPEVTTVFSREITEDGRFCSARDRL